MATTLWTVDAGPQGLAEAMTRPALATASLGRLAGLLSSDLLLLQIILMARVPIIEAAYDRAERARIHRLVGTGALLLVVLHVTMVVSARAILTVVPAVQAFYDVVAGRWDMVLALVAACLLVLVAATSAGGRLHPRRFELWRLLHLNAYLGVGFALPHQLLAGSAFHTMPAATVYWVGLYVLAAGLLITYRGVVPVRRILGTRISVDQVVAEGPDVVSVHLRGAGLERTGARAGQWFTWRFLGAGTITTAHPFSLSAAPTPGRWRITVRTTGDGGQQIAALRPGTWVLADGPYGHLTAEARTMSRVAFIGAGLGIAPLRALAEEMDYGPGDAVLAYRVRDESELLFVSELAELERRRGLDITILSGPRAQGNAAWLPAHIAVRDDVAAVGALLPDIAGRDVFVCGPSAWCELVERSLRRAGVPARQIHVEGFE